MRFGNTHLRSDLAFEVASLFPLEVDSSCIASIEYPHARLGVLDPRPEQVFINRNQA
jgi:hypothetical protein